MKKAFKLSVLTAGLSACVFLVFFFAHRAEADTASTGAASALVTPTAAVSVVSGSWQEDVEVTTVGKSAARAREFLNWTLSIKGAGFESDSGSGAPQALLKLWSAVRNIVSVLYIIIIIVIAFGMILHLSWADRSRRALVALIISFALTFLSFSAELLIIRGTDQLQQAFYTIHKSDDKTLTSDQKHLRAEDLLTVAFNYQSFNGYRRAGAKYDEAVRSHLLLVKATAVTNYLIALLIIIRIIFLWGLVIFSPFVLPFFVFSLTKKVAIVWVREFFRWLFLGPLFALFLTAIPYLWQKTEVNVSNVYPGQKAQKSGVPIEINTGILRDRNGATGENVYQSGTNLLLTPPKNTSLAITDQDVISNGNNLTDTDTYARYIIALLMIWGAIILPFLLLRIIMGFSVEIGKGISNVWNKSSAPKYLTNIQNKVGVPPPKPIQPKPGPGIYKQVGEKAEPSALPSILRDRTRTLKDNLSIPYIMSLSGLKQTAPKAMEFISKDKKSLSDLAKLEQSDQDVKNANEVLSKIAKPETIQDKAEAERFTKIKQAISDKDMTGDELARSIKSAISQSTGKVSAMDTLEQAKDNALADFVRQLSEAQPGENIIRQRLSAQSKTNPLAQNALSALQNIDGLKSALSQDNLSHEQRRQIVQEVIAIKHPETVADPTRRGQYEALKSVLTAGEKLGDPKAKEIGALIRSVVAISYKESPEIKQKVAETTANSFFNSLNKVKQVLQGKQTDPNSQLALRAMDKILRSIGDQAAAIGQIKDHGLKVFADNALKIKDTTKLEKDEQTEFDALGDEVEKNAASGNADFQKLQKTTEDVIEEAGNIDQLQASNVEELRGLLGSDQDFQKVRQMWEEYYSNAPVPLSEQTKTRADWIIKEKARMQQTLQDLLSSDPTKREDAIKNVGKILPFVLMGKYKNSEIAKYLLAKIDAADKVYKQLTGEKKENEDDLVFVKKAQRQDQEEKKMALE